MIIKRLFGLIGALTALIMPWSGASAAQDLLFGQQHAYSVTLRGNGEAVVTARLVLTNHSGAPLTTTSFTVPDVTATDMQGYQQLITATPCNVTTLIYPQQPCVTPEPDYAAAPSYYGDSQTTYSKLKFSVSGSTYQVTLPSAVQPDKSTALLLSYAAKGYVKTSFGRSTFVFKTLKVGERVVTSTVSVSTDSDLYLEGATASVNYNTTQAKAADMIQSGASSAVSSPELNRISALVGSDGELTKTAKNLAAGETYSVKGTYADARWKLGLPRYLWGAGILLLFVILLVASVRFAHRRQTRQPVVAPEDGVAAPDHAVAKPAAVEDAAQSKDAIKSVAHGGWETMLAPLPVIAGLASALAASLLTWGLVGYYTNADSTVDTFMAMTLSIVGLLLYVLIVIGPIVWIGLTHRNWRLATVAILWQVIGLLIVLALYISVFRPAASPDYGNGVTPIMYPASGGASSSGAAQ